MFHEDHPRVCGEYHSRIDCFERCPGSPPRLRGIFFNGHSLLHLIRITPASAGNMFTNTVFNNDSGDHPRVCGEYLHSVIYCATMSGSPPRLRGISIITNWNNTTIRITPASAGNIQRHGFEPAEGQDHPRVCGEYANLPFASTLSLRITPASAGNMVWQQEQMVLCLGSPPRLRGIY